MSLKENSNRVQVKSNTDSTQVQTSYRLLKLTVLRENVALLQNSETQQWNKQLQLVFDFRLKRRVTRVEREFPTFSRKLNSASSTDVMGVIFLVSVSSCGWWTARSSWLTFFMFCVLRFCTGRWTFPTTTSSRSDFISVSRQIFGSIVPPAVFIYLFFLTRSSPIKLIQGFEHRGWHQSQRLDSLFNLLHLICSKMDADPSHDWIELIYCRNITCIDNQNCCTLKKVTVSKRWLQRTQKTGLLTLQSLCNNVSY